MQVTRKVRAQLLAQGSLYTVLLLALVMLLAWVAREYRSERDITANARNTLSQGTQDALRQFDGPVSVRDQLDYQALYVENISLKKQLA